MTKLDSAEYLDYAITTASAGGIPLTLASLLGPMSEYNQIPPCVAFFLWITVVGTELVSRAVTLGEF